MQVVICSTQPGGFVFEMAIVVSNSERQLVKLYEANKLLFE